MEQGWRDKLEGLIARRREMWPHLAAGVVVTIVALVISGRSAPARIAPPAQPPTTPEVSSSGVVLVHVSGAVKRPGLYEFPAGARVVDAIETAGGPTRAADLSSLNLAAALQDGTKIDVLKTGQAASAMPAVGGSPAPALIPLNTADQAALETIPGVGPVTATAILEYRTQIGGFASLEQLLEVEGVGPATFDAIRDYVTL